MSKPDILQMGLYPDWDQAPLDAAFHMHRYFAAADKAAFLAEVGPKVRAIATRGELGANAAIIAACPQLEVISVYGVGYDAVDLAACRARGIRVTNTPDVLTETTADGATKSAAPSPGTGNPLSGSNTVTNTRTAASNDPASTAISPVSPARNPSSADCYSPAPSRRCRASP